MKHVNGIGKATIAAAALACAAVAWAGPPKDHSEHKAAKQTSHQENVSQDRQELTQMAKQAIETLRSKNQSAAAALKQAYGYAVFDTTKGGLIVTGLGGTGVALEQNGASKTFMHVGGGGIGLGAGLTNYKLIVLLKNKQTYRDFINGEWTASGSAQAVGATSSATATTHWQHGVAVYRLTDAGLFAQADISGLKFWPSDRLNKAGKAA